MDEPALAPSFKSNFRLRRSVYSKPVLVIITAIYIILTTFEIKARLVYGYGLFRSIKLGFLIVSSKDFRLFGQFSLWDWFWRLWVYNLGNRRRSSRGLYLFRLS